MSSSDTLYHLSHGSVQRFYGSHPPLKCIIWLIRSFAESHSRFQGHLQPSLLKMEKILRYALLLLAMMKVSWKERNLNSNYQHPPNWACMPVCWSHVCSHAMGSAGPLAIETSTSYPSQAINQPQMSGPEPRPSYISYNDHGRCLLSVRYTFPFLSLCFLATECWTPA